MPHITWTNDQIDPILRANAKAPLVAHPWLCDIVGATADIIQRHNSHLAKLGEPVPAKFACAKPVARPLTDLLWEDFAFLAQGEPSLRNPNGTYVLAEEARRQPNSRYVKVLASGRLLHLIYVRSPLLHFIHSAFSKAMLLMQNDRLEGSLPEDESTLMSPAYSEENLVAQWLNAIEVFFNEGALEFSNDPPHLCLPYDYCEAVQGARRFMLAHEIGHAHFHFTDEEEFLTQGIEQLGVDKALAVDWVEELFCDRFAAFTILDIYEDLLDQGLLDEGRVYELKNAVAAFFLFFIVLEHAHRATKEELPLDKPHPPLDLRLVTLHEVVKEHPLLAKLPELRAHLAIAWSKVNVFRDLRGVLWPGGWGGILAERSFTSRLSPFGLAAYRAIAGHRNPGKVEMFPPLYHLWKK